jgi:hypothetical protein
VPVSAREYSLETSPFRGHTLSTDALVPAGRLNDESPTDADGSNIWDLYPRGCELPVAWSPDGSQVMES